MGRGEGREVWVKVKCKGKLEFTLNAYKGSKNGERA